MRSLHRVAVMVLAAPLFGGCGTSPGQDWLLEADAAYWAHFDEAKGLPAGEFSQCDWNLDGFVSGADWAGFLGDWREGTVDFNDDGSVDCSDVEDFYLCWGPSRRPVFPAPCRRFPASGTGVRPLPSGE